MWADDPHPEVGRLQRITWTLSSMFPDGPEGRLWREVFMQAVSDAMEYVPGQLNTFYATDAYWYLSQREIQACEVCGIDSDFARRVLTKNGILR